MTDQILPPLPPQPSSSLLVIFSSAAWRWIGQAFESVHTEHEAIIETAAALTAAMERILMALDDLSASQDRSEASTTAALGGISKEIQQVRDAVAALGTSPSAAELAAFKARVDANTDRIDAAVALLSADDPAA